MVRSEDVTNVRKLFKLETRIYSSMMCGSAEVVVAAADETPLRITGRAVLAGGTLGTAPANDTAALGGDEAV